MSQRTLVVLRHAKSAWPPGLPDHDRPLAERGRRDAPVAGRWIGAHVGPPDAVLVSTAVRTRQTWELAAPGTGFAGDESFDARIYEASVADLLGVLSELPGTVSRVVLVGHNPGCEALSRSLAGTWAAAAWEQMNMKFPTAAVAVLTLPGSWRDIAAGAGYLADFTVARG